MPICPASRVSIQVEQAGSPCPLLLGSLRLLHFFQPLPGPQTPSFPWGFHSAASVQLKDTLGLLPLSLQSHMCPLGLKLCVGHSERGQYLPRLLAACAGRGPCSLISILVPAPCPFAPFCHLLGPGLGYLSPGRHRLGVGRSSRGCPWASWRKGQLVGAKAMFSPGAMAQQSPVSLRSSSPARPRGLPAHAVPTPRDSLVAHKVYFCLDGLKGVPRSQVPCTKSPSKSLRVALFLTPGWN